MGLISWGWQKESCQQLEGKSHHFSTIVANGIAWLRGVLDQGQDPGICGCPRQTCPIAKCLQQKHAVTQSFMYLSGMIYNLVLLYQKSKDRFSWQKESQNLNKSILRCWLMWRKDHTVHLHMPFAAGLGIYHKVQLAGLCTRPASAS